ncbi:MAG: hypothetical protein IJY58_04375 [Alphaproteobacteria bacterium]|nr:hypothetical protein [Alphaproteobacteria bacterium]
MSLNLSTVYVDWVKLDGRIISGKRKSPIYILISLNKRKGLVWLERMPNCQPLTVMFTAMKSFREFNEGHRCRIHQVVTDSKKEFCAKKYKSKHPFERLLLEMGFLHGVRRLFPLCLLKFEQILFISLNDEGVFETLEEFDSYLLDFVTYYNHPEIINIFSEYPNYKDFDFYKAGVGENLTNTLAACQYIIKQKKSRYFKRSKKSSEPSDSDTSKLSVYDGNFNPLPDYENQMNDSFYLDAYDSLESEQSDFEVTKQRTFRRFLSKERERKLKEKQNNQLQDQDFY